MYRYRVWIKSIYRAEPVFLELYADNDSQAHSFACRSISGVVDFKIISMIPKEVLA